MPIPGRKPKPPEERRNRVQPRHDWTEVEAVAFEGAPELPPKRGSWSRSARRWWQAISTMPHCCLWEPADWQFAFDTALLAAAFYAGDVRLATELRQRERVMGTTVDARRDLRIRYVEPRPAGVALVDNIADYRRELKE